MPGPRRRWRHLSRGGPGECGLCFGWCPGFGWVSREANFEKTQTMLGSILQTNITPHRGCFSFENGCAVPWLPAVRVLPKADVFWG